MSSIVELQDIRKSFRPRLFGEKIEAVCGVSFTVREGESFGCLGRNGAGKTTLLKILTGLLRPDSGKAHLLGFPCGHAGARSELGYLPENPYFHEHLTPEEGLSLLGRLSGLSHAAILGRRDELLERVGLGAARQRRIRTFSKGMRQRFGLAAALLHQPRLLLLDEPLSGLDPAGRQLVKDIVLEERKAGRTVVLCSHVLADVEEMCDRVLVLHEGKVVRDGAISELLQDRPQSFELCVEAAPADLRRMLLERSTKHHEVGTRLTVQLPGAEMGPGLATYVQKKGVRVLALIPERETLERWFVKLTSSSPAAAEPPIEEEVVKPSVEEEVVA